MVSTKFLPATPNSQAVRAITWRGARAVASSPASLDRPYAVAGATGSDSTYGSRLRPSKT